MHYAVKESLPDAEVICAFDINTVANDVYEHNFGKRPYQGNIEKLSSSKLDSYKADMWLLAPPCQPYTRRGLQKDADDWRASSFMKLLSKLSEMQVRPSYLLVENVVGFEQSRTRAAMQSLMQTAGYIMQEFLISPTQLGIPYSRPRYFAVMKRLLQHGKAHFQLQTEDVPFTQLPSQLMQHACDATAVAKTDTGQPPDTSRSSPTDSTASPTTPVPRHHSAAAPFGSDGGTASAATAPAQRVDNHNHVTFGPCQAWDSKGVVVKPIRNFLEGNSHVLSADRRSEVAQQSGSSQTPTQIPDSVLPEDGPIASQTCRHADEYCVPRCVLHKWGNVLDIVTPESLATNCFTKTYTQYAKGCGSVLATTNLNNISFQMSKRQRSSSSQDFVKPRMIARPILLSSCSTSSTLAPGATLQEPHLNAGAVDRTSCHSSAHAEHDDALTIEPETDSTTSQQDEAMLGWLGSLQLRYFTPREVANLHSFPASFDFPQGVTRKQQYALLGNSLSVAVVSHLLTYLMS